MFLCSIGSTRQHNVKVVVNVVSTTGYSVFDLPSCRNDKTSEALMTSEIKAQTSTSTYQGGILHFVPSKAAPCPRRTFRDAKWSCVLTQDRTRCHIGPAPQQIDQRSFGSHNTAVTEALVTSPVNSSHQRFEYSRGLKSTRGEDRLVHLLLR
jgi:hypothetical protein